MSETIAASSKSQVGPYIAPFAAIFGALAVGMGAFGAHGLKAILGAQELDWWNKAAHYHLIHALAALAAGLAWSRVAPGRPQRAVALAGLCFFVGIVLFAGSLYVMALTDQLALGAVTPFGGVAFIAGWLALAIGMWPRRG